LGDAARGRTAPGPPDRLTLLLETEPVLRAAYGFEPAQIHAAFVNLLGLPNLHTDAPERVHQALDWFANGLDFADALHLALSRPADKFATFDETLVRRAKKIDGPAVIAV
jgi:predicted nucleic acid-binding protein